jgi:hypothetical protein
MALGLWLPSEVNLPSETIPINRASYTFRLFAIRKLKRDVEPLILIPDSPEQEKALASAPLGLRVPL